MSYRNLTTPAAILITGILVSGAVFYSSRSASVLKTGDGSQAATQENQPTPSIDNVRPVLKDRDHILGNPDAPIKIIEYSDTECPFCKQFHFELQKIIT